MACRRGAAPARRWMARMTHEAAPARSKPDTPAKDLGVTELTPEEEERPEIYFPRDIKTVFLGGLFFLATLVALYVGAPIILPIVLAVVLKLLLQPALRPFENLHIPRAIGS